MNTRKNLLFIVILLILSLACSIFSSPNISTNESEEPANNLPAESSKDATPALEPDADIPIQEANTASTLDCNLFDVAKFNAITGDEFKLAGAKEDSCGFLSPEGKILTIGGGEPADVEKAKTLFEMSFGAVPDAKWQVYDEGFQLGIAPGGMSVTGQGVSASGNAILIIGVGKPTDDLDVLHDTLRKLVEEAARQLNEQW